MRAGRYVTIVGPDGVGKTTFRLALLEQLEPVVEVRSDRRGGPLVEMRKRAGDRPVDASSGSSMGRLLSTAKLLYLFADQWLRWARELRRWRAGGGWIVVERGWWDLAVFPARYRMAPPGRLHRWLGRITPRPDLIIVLEADAATVVARKDELPATEVARQSQRWHEVLPEWQPRVYLDASLRVDRLVAEALAALGGAVPPAEPTGQPDA